jgi:large subunit ribosomal protein L6
MSRVGLKPVPVPEKCTVEVAAGAISVKGPGGTLRTPLPAGITCKVVDRQLRFERGANDGPTRARHGMARALAANAIAGVVTPFEARLEIIGVGFRASVAGKKLQLSLGYSHPVEFPFPAGVTLAVEDQTKIVVRGADKQAVGQCAAELRALRAPDAYKGKGIRYQGEVIKLKAGKAAGK